MRNLMNKMDEDLFKSNFGVSFLERRLRLEIISLL